MKFWMVYEVRYGSPNGVYTVGVATADHPLRAIEAMRAMHARVWSGPPLVAAIDPAYTLISWQRITEDEFKLAAEKDAVLILENGDG